VPAVSTSAKKAASSLSVKTVPEKGVWTECPKVTKPLLLTETSL
jgi:hypothetical protein